MLTDKPVPATDWDAAMATVYIYTCCRRLGIWKEATNREVKENQTSAAWHWSPEIQSIYQTCRRGCHAQSDLQPEVGFKKAYKEREQIPHSLDQDYKQTYKETVSSLIKERSTRFLPINTPSLKA